MKKVTCFFFIKNCGHCNENVWYVLSTLYSSARIPDNFFMTLKYDFQLVGPMKNVIPLRTDIESAISAILGFRRDTNIKRLSFEFLH